MSQPTPTNRPPKTANAPRGRETPKNQFGADLFGKERGSGVRELGGWDCPVGPEEPEVTGSVQTVQARGSHAAVHTVRNWQREAGKQFHQTRRIGAAGGRLRLDPEENGGEAAGLKEELQKMIAGQAEAIREIVNVYQMHLAGLTTPDRPIGALLLLGPTGTGKTRIVEAVAEALVGTPRAVLKIDCGEFQHSHEVAKLVGSPPGYLGHRETHPLLSQETLNQYHTDQVKLSFVLFDEIEKASDAVWNLLLGILDKATLTLGDNRRVDFSDSIVFLTSNLGAKEMSSILSPGVGFGTGTDAGRTECSEDTMQRVRRAAIEAARRKFTPEFINRLDKMIVFHPLGTSELRRIVDIELCRLQDRILMNSAAGGFVLRVTDQVRERLLHEGVDSRYGARHLRRAIESLIVQPLSSLVASGKVRQGDLVQIDDEGGERLSFCLVGQDLSMETMSESAGPSVAPMLRLAAALAGERNLASIV
jgi:ATP-dependent Clp protease ATP-binding subunit ClpA